jgi:hypothetical protein
VKHPVYIYNFCLVYVITLNADVVILIVYSFSTLPYFSIDNARVFHTKSLNSLKMNMRGIHLKGMRGKPYVK